MVTPPAAAAANSVSASLAARGRLMSEPCPRWMCASTTPGMTRRPFRSSRSHSCKRARSSDGRDAAAGNADIGFDSGSVRKHRLAAPQHRIKHARDHRPSLASQSSCLRSPGIHRQRHRTELAHDNVSRRDHRRNRYRQHHLIYPTRLESLDLSRDFRIPAREGKAGNDVVRDQGREISLAHFRAGGNRRPA